MELRSQKMLTEAQISEMFGISQATLRTWRWQKKGPRYYKAGRNIRYKIEDVDAYFVGQPVETVDSVKTQQQQEA
jgi:predicted site-specific integrase-resolvase